jgi:hypothetical protein
MATINITPGYNWTSGEVVTPTKLNSAATPAAALAAGSIVNADINSAAAISGSKLQDVSVPVSKLETTLDLSGNFVTLPNNNVTAAKLSNSGTAGTGVGYVRVAATVGANSYVTLQGPTGTRFVMAWGKTTTTSTGGLTTVNFPVTFSAAPAVTATVAGILFGFVRVVSLGNITTTNFEYSIIDNVGVAQNHAIHWQAFGPVA